MIPDHTLLRLIGRGSYGEVWLAKNLAGAFRAVKLVYQSRFEDSKPFEREFHGILRYEPLSRTHDSQVDILHVGQQEAAGFFFYVMELADDQETGQEIQPETYRPRTLRSEIHRRERLPLDECLRIGLSLATALGHLHRNGLVHRDVKPSNIIFINGIPKLADVGLIADTEDTQSFVGTEGFLPPEGPGQPQADLYALGKVLYEIGFGMDRKAFPELPTEFRQFTEQKGLLELNEIILKACHPDPRQRYQTAEELHADLALIQGGKSLIVARNLERHLAVARRYGRLLVLISIAVTVVCWHVLRTRQQIARQLVRFQVAQGVRLTEQGQLADSLPWFAEAVRLAPDDQELHRLRFGFVASQCAKPVRVFIHRRDLNDLVFSPDGRWLLTASDDGNARVWDLYSGQPKTPWLHHRLEVNSGRFSPDGRWVLTASNDRCARMWDPRTGDPAGSPMEHDSEVNEAIFSPDGLYVLAATQKGSISTWDARTCARMGDAVLLRQPVRNLVFSPDGRFLVCRSGGKDAESVEGRVWLWRWMNSRLADRIELPISRVVQVVFSPDSKKMAVATANQLVQVFSIATEQPSALFSLAHDAAVLHVAFSPEGQRLVTSSADHLARIWDAEGGRLLIPEIRHLAAVRQAQFSPDGRWIATASEDHTVMVSSVQTGEKIFSGLTHGSWVNRVVFDPSGFLIASAGADSVARVWKLASPAGREHSFHCSQPLQAAILSPDGRFAAVAYGAAGRPAVIQVWNTLTRKSLHRITDFRAPVTHLSISQDGQRLVSVGEDGRTRIWSFHGYALTAEWELGTPVHWIGFSPDGKKVVAAGGTSDGRGWARVWDASNGRPLSPCLPHETEVLSAVMSPDNRILLTASGRTAGLGEARFWDIGTGQPVYVPLKHAAQVTHACFSPDGRKVATSSLDHTARIWNATNGLPWVPFLKHAGPVTRIKFSADGSRVVTVSDDKSARVWNADNGDPVTPPLWHADQVIDANFSSDQCLLVTAGRDSMARVWNVRSGEAITLPLRHRGPVILAAFDPENQFVFTAGLDPVARLWSLVKDTRPVPDLVAVANLLSSQQIHSQGGLVPLKPDEIWSNLRRLKSKYPREFELTVQELIEWHQRQAAHYERNQDWRAAAFHIESGLQLDSNNPQWMERRARNARSVRSLTQLEGQVGWDHEEEPAFDE